MNTIQIQHVPNSDPPQFRVVRERPEYKAAEPVAVPSPVGYLVAGRPNDDLLSELRWYLETFLDYPYPPETDHAERVLAALTAWGTDVFNALFNTRPAADFLASACENNRYDNLHLQISADDPEYLAWPWEALFDPHARTRLAQSCQIDRRLSRLADPPALDPNLPRDRVNILLVVARPFERDVRFRSIARPLVDLVHDQQLPATVTVLRPPTFDNLRRHLEDHPHTYHVLHFDGHGGYSSANPAGAGPPTAATPYTYADAQGHLLFETKRGEPDPISATTLAELLREHALPAVVLNACRSAMVDKSARDPFASVAAALLSAGARSVLAMSYSLYVSAARVFIPPLYEQLFRTGDLAIATRRARQQLFREQGRICARGTFPLQDWLVPVLYQQQPLSFDFAREAAAETTAKRPASRLPEQARDSNNPFGFIGRDQPLLDLERALHHSAPVIQITGLGGVGKTTLIRGFLDWLERTNGLPDHVFWFKRLTDDIRSAEFIINRLGEAFYGPNFAAADLQARVTNLIAKLRDTPALIVWDNFETATGIPGTTVQPSLNDDDRALLAEIVRKIDGGKTKLIFTTRSPDRWPADEYCNPVAISGLDREERWEYCDVLLQRLGIDVTRDTDDFKELIDALAGHPLAMRAILPALQNKSPASVLIAVRSNLDDLNLPAGDAEEHLAATLRFVEESLPDELQPLLIPLALHEAYLDADGLEHMARQVDAAPDRAAIDRFITALANAGLLRDVRAKTIFEIHPALTGYLRATVLAAALDDGRTAWTRAFVAVFGSAADQFAPQKLHEQRIFFLAHGANLHAARAAAHELAMPADFGALTQALAAFALHCRDLDTADRLYANLAASLERVDQPQHLATVCHQLGIVAQERRDFDAAETWYRKSLEIKERLRNEHGAASTYHQLGTVAQARRDFDAAETWYRNSLEIKERLQDEQGAASTYHQLGRVAEEQRDFATAETWYRKSLEIKERLGNEHGAATTYHQLGRVAEERRDFDAAETWYRNSLEINERLGNEHGAATTYHQLGVVAQERRDFAAAETWYRKSLTIKERARDEHGAASTYHQLGVVAQERRDFDAAETWYRKSLEIKERLGDDHGAAPTYHQLGIIAEQRRDFDAAEEWYRKSLEIKERLGNEHGAALTLAQLGLLARAREQFSAAAALTMRAARSFDALSDPHYTQQTLGDTLRTYAAAPPADQARIADVWSAAGFSPPLPDFAATYDSAREGEGVPFKIDASAPLPPLPAFVAAAPDDSENEPARLAPSVHTPEHPMPANLLDRVNDLSDEAAVRLLKTISSARRRTVGDPPPLTPELLTALTAELDAHFASEMDGREGVAEPASDPTTPPPSHGKGGEGVAEPADPAQRGELARTALALYALDPDTAGPLDDLLAAEEHQSAPRAYGLDPITGTVFVAAVLIALQTHFKIERDKSGRLSFKIEKKPTSDALLTPLLKKLVNLFRGSA